MTRKELERTSWAKEFKDDSPVSYATAIMLALDPDLRVVVNRTDDAGDLMPGFWMDAKPTKKAALELCKKMG